MLAKYIADVLLGFDKRPLQIVENAANLIVGADVIEYVKKIQRHWILCAGNWAVPGAARHKEDLMFAKARCWASSNY